MTDPRDDPTRLDQPTRVDEPTTVLPGPADLDPPGGPPPWDDRPGDGPPPSRLPWVIAALLVAVVLVLLALLLLDDDDDDGDVTAGTSTTELATSTTVEPSSTTSTTAPTTTTEAPSVTLDPDDCDAAGANAAQPGLAAQTVFEAWTIGDQSCADLLMTDDALTELFSRDGAGATDELQGCTEQDEPDPHADCAFTYEGGSTHYLMSFSPTTGWQVFDIEQIAD